MGGATRNLFLLLVFFNVPLCPIAFWLHVPCPGCGLTRASLRLLQGDLRGALAYHPLVPIALPFVTLFFGTNALIYIQTGQWGRLDSYRGRWGAVLALVLAALAVSVWISRFFGAFGGPVAVSRL